MVGLIQHLESYLGTIDVGWSRTADGEDLSFQVVRFGAGALPGCVVFSTLGLSSVALPSRESGKLVRHEFVMIVPERLQDGPVPGLLQQVGLEVMEAGSPLLRGDVVGPRGPLFAMSSMEALYASVPVYLPDDFAQVDDVVFVWLVPVSQAEANFVAANGWSAFEDRLVEAGPDLIDVDRLSIVS